MNGNEAYNIRIGMYGANFVNRLVLNLLFSFCFCLNKNLLSPTRIGMYGLVDT